MRQGAAAEPARAADADALRPAESRPLRALPLEEDPAEREAREALLRRLAADRLRDLRDDGVTMAYVARMYGVEAALLESVAADVLPARSR